MPSGEPLGRNRKETQETPPTNAVLARHLNSGFNRSAKCPHGYHHENKKPDGRPRHDRYRPILIVANRTTAPNEKHNGRQERQHACSKENATPSEFWNADMRRKAILSRGELDKLMFKRIVDHASKRHVMRLARQIVHHLKRMRDADLPRILRRISQKPVIPSAAVRSSGVSALRRSRIVRLISLLSNICN